MTLFKYVFPPLFLSSDRNDFYFWGAAGSLAALDVLSRPPGFCPTATSCMQQRTSNDVLMLVLRLLLLFVLAGCDAFLSTKPRATSTRDEQLECSSVLATLVRFLIFVVVVVCSRLASRATVQWW